jgi:sugar (pentulose or hexulose) kinase
MAQHLRCVRPESVITGWDFSTGGVKHLAFDLDGNTLASLKQTTDLWTEKDVSELNLAQLEGQARGSVRQMASALRKLERLENWASGGISATHHTAGRIDKDRVQVRRAICWDDQTLAAYYKEGLARLGGEAAAEKIIRGPWAARYGLSHLVKDEVTLPSGEWERTWRILPHGPLAAGYLTGNFDVISVSAAASSGMMNFELCGWEWDMLAALKNLHYHRLVREQLPRIIDQYELVGPLSESLALEAHLPEECRPLIFPTSDDQQAGLVGGGAVEDGQLAIVLGNSAVVNSSSNGKPHSGSLDVMRLNWGPYLWMRCYSNGAQFLDKVVGEKPDWKALEEAGRAVPPGCGGVTVMPFARKELALGVTAPAIKWEPAEPSEVGVRFRAALEALAYLIARGVKEHEDAGQTVKRISVSGGIARSDLMCEILAGTLGRNLERLRSDEGPALGAAVTSLSALETHLRHKAGIPEPFTVADAVEVLVKFREPAEPNPSWQPIYARGLAQFEDRLRRLTGKP